MKMIKKAVLVIAAVFMSGYAFSFNWGSLPGTADGIAQYKAQTGAISDGLDDFAKELAVAIPQAATQQNVWADAYIGKLFPSILPHFGGGFNAAVTHVDTSGLAKAAKSLNIDGIEDSYYFPVFTADLRVGGVLLPFDVDIAVMKTGTLSTDKLPGADLSVDFLTFGIEGRYALLEGGLITPCVSVGAGYFYNKGTFGAKSSYADSTIDYNVQTLYASAQISKSILFITPFAGVRGLVSKYDNSWSWKIKNSAALAAIDTLNTFDPTAKVKAYDSGSEKSDMFDFNAVQPQFFAGVGMGFLIFDITASVTADLRNMADSGLWSGAVSVRASL